MGWIYISSKSLSLKVVTKNFVPWAGESITSALLEWMNEGLSCALVDVFSWHFLGGVYMRKLAPARDSHWDDFLISYRVYMMTGSFHILLFNGTFHVDKIHVWFKIANIAHALLVPVYRQTDFTPKWVVVSRLHDTVARFCTGVKFSPRCENRGELTPGWTHAGVTRAGITFCGGIM